MMQPVPGSLSGGRTTLQLELPRLTLEQSEPAELTSTGR